MKHALFCSFLVFLCGFWPTLSYSQVKPNSDKEAFYRPVTHTDLITILPPRVDADTTFGNNLGSFFSGDDGCPEDINIGSITDDSSVFGSVDIEVFIDSDIVITCE